MKKQLKVKYKGKALNMWHNSPNIIRTIESTGNNFYEIWMLRAIADLPYRPGICMDIGANVGNHTVFFSRFCNFDEVWAYEPNKETFKLLKENVEANCIRTVRLFNCAVGDTDGYVRMTDLINPAINKVSQTGVRTRIVPVTTNVKVALMKIDVEGHEPDVLRGAYNVIERDKPEIFAECHTDPTDLLLLLPKGYEIIKRYNNAPTYHYSFCNALQ